MFTRFRYFLVIVLLFLLIPTQVSSQVTSCQYTFLEVSSGAVLAFNYPNPDNLWFSVWVGGRWYSSWGNIQTDYMEFQLPEGVRMQAGDLATASDGYCYREHELRYLEPDPYYAGQTTVYGSSNPNEAIIFRYEAWPDVIRYADNRGRWSINLTATYDLHSEDIQAGFVYEALIADELGNTTLTVNFVSSLSCANEPATIWVYVAPNGVEYISGGPDNGNIYNSVIQGTSGNDVIIGTAKRDYIYSDGGYDIICAMNGNDNVRTFGTALIFGGGGDDILVNGESATIFGDDGNDLILAGNGENFLEGGAGFDRIFGGNGHDEIFAHFDGERDLIHAGGGNDICFANMGFDRILGDSCEDIVWDS